MVTRPSVPLEPDSLERIRVRYATYRDQSAGARAALAAQLGDIDADERVLLDTCHRVELVTVGGGETDDDVTARGRDAIRRVFTVVGGFDSAVVAEEQLIGQVRAAFASAMERGTTGPILNELFRRALRFGRRVRSLAAPGTDRSLADPGVAWLEERLPARASVVVAGTGEMGRLIATRLADAGHRVIVVSRSPDRAAQLVDGLAGGEHRTAVGSLDADAVALGDAVALAVRVKAPALELDALPADGPMPFVLDLSAPPAVSPDAAARLGDRLLELDRLAAAAGSAPVLTPQIEGRLRAELDAEVERFVSWLDTRRGADALAVLHGEADAVRRRHLDRLRRRAALDEPQLAAVEAAAAAMLGELLHGPSQELRRGGADAATVRRLFGLDA